jgi:hypothetical protein
MRIATVMAAAALAMAQPAWADEFEEVLDSALEAYRAGDVSVAREDLEYAMRLLGEMEAQTLAGFLPEPLDGWTREAEDTQSGGMPMAMLGGGTAAAATYRRDGEEFTLTLMANSPMVSGMAAMFSGMASMGSGRSVRIQRQTFAISDGEIQGVVGGTVLVQAQGRAPVEDMQAHIEAMDLGALGAF